MLLTIGLLSVALASPVFIIDDGDGDVDDLVVSLTSSGHTVETSGAYGFTEGEFMGFEVDLDAFDVVIWLDGVGAAVEGMPEFGQERLLQYVEDGGGVVLFGQNGFNYLAGMHSILAPLIPLRSWTMVADSLLYCIDEDHALCDGFDEDDHYDVSGGFSQAGSIHLGEPRWKIDGWWEDYNGAVTYELGVGRGVQWALWGDSYSDHWQTPWWDATVSQMLDNSVRWAGQGPPRPDAGGPYEGMAGDVIALDGSGSTARGDASLVLYQWSVDGYEWSTPSPTTTLETDIFDGPVLGSVTLTVTDSEGRSQSQSTSLSLTNADPVITLLTCSDSLEEGESGSFRVGASDPEIADTLSFSWLVDGLPTSIGSSVDIGFVQDGVFTVSVQVFDDDGGSVSADCADLVSVANVRPMIVGDPELSVDAGHPYTFTPAVDDPGIYDVHSWTGVGPTGLSVDPDTGHILWTPGIDDIGTHTITLSVFDGVDEHTEAWVLTVQWPDDDGDGVLADTDCDDTDDAVFPGAVEACDGIDSDCDDSLVDGYSDLDGDATPDCIDDDADGDGHEVDADCDDADPWVHPGATEGCDLEDSDCDGSLVDGFADGDEDGLPDCIDEDTDGDGMTDAWEETYGLDPHDGSDGGTDTDGDGRTAIAEYLGGSDPTVYEGPGQPEIFLPLDGGEINAFPPVLVVIDGAAPLGQDLVHSMTLATDESLASVVSMVEGLESVADGTTGWMIDVELEENTWYHWTAAASDDWTTGPAMDPAGFFYNLINEPPGAPSLNSPLDGSATDVLDLVVDVPADPDLDAVEIIFTLSLEDGSQLESPPMMGEEPTVTWAPVVAVDDGMELCWWAVAVDEHGLFGPDSAVACFGIDRVNLGPSAPSFEAPSVAVVDTLTPTLVVSNGIDPEGAATAHRFQVDIEPGFGSSSLVEATVSSGPDGQTTWMVETPFLEDTMVFARALCTDGEHDSEWVSTEFYVSATNDPPSVPGLLDPADGVAFAEGGELVISHSVDPEGETVSLEIHILDLRDNVIEAVIGLDQGEESTRWVPAPLVEGNYQWTARAIDNSGVVSAWADPRSMVVGSPDHVDEPALGGMVSDANAEGCGCTQSGSRRSFGFVLLVLAGLLQRRKMPRC